LRRDDSATIWRTLGLGAITGVRSMAAPAILSRSAVEERIGSLEGTPFAALASPRVSTALQLLEMGEMVGDKTPIIPSRTSLLPLLGRAAIGAFAGAALFASGKRPVAAGAALGAVSATAAAYAAEGVRMRITERLGVPNVVAGLLEDGIVLLGGPRLLR
jgi:uncharacterized membrane protein